MTKLGKKSKRQTTKHRVKVEKKVREHNRKLRKEAKKNPKKGAKKKDPGVPNILPFRDEVIKEAQAYNAKKEEEREKKKEARKKARERLQNKNRNMGAIVKDAEKRQAAYDKQDNPGPSKVATSSINAPENSRKAFYKEFKKVIDAADVVLEVLDARDPMGSRSVEVEEAVRSAEGNKKLVLVLNKIDLVPKENIEAWLKHLRKELPAIAFKASTQQQRDHLTQSKVDYFTASSELLKSSHCLGADVLMKLLRNYCRNTEMAINVGVVGFPNTGKSSIINSLKRAKACDVGANPGITKAMQSVQLDKHIKLLDSPGVVLSSSSSDVAAVLRNVVRLESLDDPVPCVEAILTRCQKMQMMLHYNIADYTDTMSFLTLLAQRLGKLRKGGVPDVNAAARTLLQHWNSGKITYYTAPPEGASEADHHIEAKIVSTWSKEFNIDDLLSDEQKVLDGVERKHTSPMLVASTGPMKAAVTEDDLEEEGEATRDEDMAGEEEDDQESGDEEMEEDEDVEELKGVTVKASRKQKKGVKSPLGKQLPVWKRGPPPKAPTQKFGGLVTKKASKLAQKKEKKKKKKANNLAGKLSDAMTTAFSGL